MKLTDNQQTLLRMLPGVDQLLEQANKDPFFKDVPKTVVVNAIRQVLDSRRDRILKADPAIAEQSLSFGLILQLVKDNVVDAMDANLKPLINASGVVVHTNLGRSLAPPPGSREPGADCRSLFQFGV